MSQDIPVVKGLGLPDLTNPLSFRDLAGNSCSMTFPVASENNIDWPCYRQMMREAFAVSLKARRPTKCPLRLARRERTYNRTVIWRSQSP